MRVLVVEDEAPIRRVDVGDLHQEGFEVSEAADGLRAVGLARELSPDVSILDLGLPGIDGVEVCRQVRTFSDVYVVMLTARTEEIDTLIGLSVGADDYLTKPFSPRELVAPPAANRQHHRPGVRPNSARRPHPGAEDLPSCPCRALAWGANACRQQRQGADLSGWGSAITQGE